MHFLLVVFATYTGFIQTYPTVSGASVCGYGNRYVVYVHFRRLGGYATRWQLLISG